MHHIGRDFRHSSSIVHAGTFKHNGALVNVINCTCAFLLMTSGNVCCERGLFGTIKTTLSPFEI